MTILNKGSATSKRVQNVSVSHFRSDPAIQEGTTKNNMAWHYMDAMRMHTG